ncbi:cation:proton antiporter [Streptomyces radiopugnans]|nr:cation:proton antiporter [Streptomyces radiopugnans]
MPDASELTARMLLQLAVVTAVCLVAGRLLRRVGLPQVVADMAAGFLLGPALLGLVLPSVQGELFPVSLDVGQERVPHPSLLVLQMIGQLGLVVCMFLMGLRLDRRGLAGNLSGSALTSVSGLVVPLLLGGWLGWTLAADTRFFPDGTDPVVAALLCGAAMSVTAFPVLARMVHELGLAGRTTGTVALSAAAVTDAAAWVLLAAVPVGRESTPSAALAVLAAVLGYTLLVLGPGRLLLSRLAQYAFDGTSPRGWVLPGTIVLLMSGAFAAEELGVHAVFGAFVLGVAMPRGPLADALLTRCEPLVAHLLLPVFFVYAGLNLRPEVFRAGVGAGLLALVLLVAFASKFGSCTLALRLSGFPWREAASVGVLMNARGLMELVLLDTALRHGLITPGLYTVFAAMALISTVAAPPLALLLRTRGGPAASGTATPAPAGRLAPTRTEGSTPW